MPVFFCFLVNLLQNQLKAVPGIRLWMSQEELRGAELKLGTCCVVQTAASMCKGS